jgi:putative ubiquitin-RnfH superfamily antitoxin RatB of RatAB toxin-antitoxin module
MADADTALDLPDGPVEIEVVFAEEQRVWRCHLSLPQGATAASALEAALRQPGAPSVSHRNGGLGIFGRRVAPDRIMHQGDRLEICRPLRLDPKDARRKRANSKD